MKYPACILLVAILVLVASAAFADERMIFSDIRGPEVIYGGPAEFETAAVDTAVLIGPPHLSPTVIGNFEGAWGKPPWHGWTGLDWTAPDTSYQAWHVSDYYVIDGVYSAYCGDETIPACPSGGDVDGGYGNNWLYALKWGMSVADNASTTTIGVSFDYDIDSEEYYDHAILAREIDHGSYESVWELSGQASGSATEYITYDSGEYLGPNDDEVGVLFIARSDAGYSDEDCDFPSTGFWRFDNVVIVADNPMTLYSHDFEDGTLGEFESWWRGSVGNFVQALGGIMIDPDPCVANTTSEIMFIDDGVVEPGTGGSEATTDEHDYAYGWVVNYTGGLTFDDMNELRNSVVSPVIPWANPAHDGCRFGFGFLEDNQIGGNSTGIVMEWMIRSTDGDAASIEDAPWEHSPAYYVGGPAYGRRHWDVSDMIVPDPTYVQVAIGARELNVVGTGDDGTPAPFIDNVRLETYPQPGPAMWTMPLYQANDAFPASGTVSTTNLALNSVRVDMAQNISPDTHETLRHGDSLVIDVTSVRVGAALTGNPVLHYRLKPNPLYHPYRSAGLPFLWSVAMDTVRTSQGWPIDGRFYANLPDAGFMFPGDQLHWYYSAEDAIGGPGGTDARTHTLPADTTGFSDFDDPMAYSENFTMRGLPSMVEVSPGTYEAPPILFWDDSESETRDLKNDWYDTFRRLGMVRGEHFDTYYTKSSSSAAGSGLGARASSDQLGWYWELLYSSGYLTHTTICNGDWSLGGSNDIALLEAWLDLGGRDAFLCGNGLAFDLDNSGPDFLHDHMMVDYVGPHRDLLGGQLTPRISVLSPVSVFDSVSDWFFNGGCDGFPQFDLVTPRPGGERLAEYRDAQQQTGVYPYAPATLATDLFDNNRIITLTSDLAYVETHTNEGAKVEADQAARTRLLRDVLVEFGRNPPGGAPTHVPGTGVFSVVPGPNPFNPVTEIAYTTRGPGHLSLKIYDLRGAHVRTLVDAPVEGAGRVAWDGTDAGGRRLASGVYFYEARMGGELRSGKLALVK